VKNGLEIDSFGEMRAGAVYIKNDAGDKSYTLSLVGKVGIESKAINGLSAGATFFTTNAIFGKDEEAMFLSSNGDSYSIVGEAFIRANLFNTEIKAGRQIFDSPFIDSDDIGMVPNSVEGYTLLNRGLKDTTIVLGLIDSWSGVDTPTPEEFTKMQNSGDAVFLAGIIYEGIENITLQAWQYRLKDVNWNYFEAGFENDNFSIAGQYSDQENGNRVYGLDGVYNIKNLSLHTAYNKVSGVVTNGFGGGPFFTSSEDHTVDDFLEDEEAKLIGAEYNIGDFTLGVTTVDFSNSENETDYLVSYAFNDDLTVDLIHSEMNDDGTMSRFFCKLQFLNLR
jgi:hypothetical protein